MHFVVCAKQIPDPETPPAAFRIDEARNEVIPAQGIAPVLSQFDGMAAEAALRILETAGEGKITVISLGRESAQAAIKQVLAMGADEGILLEDDALQGGDSYTTARTLAAAVRKLGDVDAVFCGRQAADWDMGQVGLGIAELLGCPRRSSPRTSASRTATWSSSASSSTASRPSRCRSGRRHRLQRDR